MNEKEREPSPSFDRIMQHLREREERLQDGGPDVDWEKVVAYVDNCLDPMTSREVERCINTWRTWYNAQIEVIAAVSELADESNEEE